MINRRTLGAAALFTLLFGCFGDRGIVVTDRTVIAGCGMCMYAMREANGCMWAVEIEGARYLVTGTLPRDHSNHAPDGMCNMTRHVVVDGHIRGDRFVATRFELLDPEEVPENPKYTLKDQHP